MKKCFWPLILLVFLATPMWGQFEGAEEGFAIRFLAPNFRFPVDNELRYDDFGGGLELEYNRHLGKALNLAIPFKYASTLRPVDEELSNFAKEPYVGLDALLQLKSFNKGQFINPSLYSGVGVHLEDFSNGVLAIPVGIGLDFRLSQGFYLSTKGEYRFATRDLRDNIQLAAGFKGLIGEFEPPQPIIQDRDGDQVPDDQDECPDVAGLIGLSGCPDADQDGIADKDDDCPLLAGVPEFNGCPDSDGDGIVDPEDECPEEAGTAANNGCPDRDADNDGIPDDEDDCPNQAGSFATNGCPDADGDGVADADDDCPNSPGTAANNGCPDRDGDGIIDNDDRCPDSPGTIANNGCPEIQEEDREVLEFATQAVNFETASAILTSESRGVLNNIVDILQRYPDYHMNIGGHTDSVGSSGSNQDLSERRAKSCYDYLIAQGVSANRLSYEGFGESQPIADNRYRDGREQNRRVEFDIYLPGAGN